ncbi:MAG: hypothetical protein ISR65_07980 [Bacteriovoracaceae bacterium]|nr:hypothetical protein [Bacteriovoracaceae bacterium]
MKTLKTPLYFMLICSLYITQISNFQLTQNYLPKVSITLHSASAGLGGSGTSTDTWQTTHQAIMTLIGQSMAVQGYTVCDKLPEDYEIAKRAAQMVMDNQANTFAKLSEFTDRNQADAQARMRGGDNLAAATTTMTHDLEAQLTTTKHAIQVTNNINRVFGQAITKAAQQMSFDKNKVKRRAPREGKREEIVLALESTIRQMDATVEKLLFCNINMNTKIKAEIAKAGADVDACWRSAGGGSCVSSLTGEGERGDKRYLDEVKMEWHSSYNAIAGPIREKIQTLFQNEATSKYKCINRIFKGEKMLKKPGHVTLKINKFCDSKKKEKKKEEGSEEKQEDAFPDITVDKYKDYAKIFKRVKQNIILTQKEIHQLKGYVTESSSFGGGNIHVGTHKFFTKKKYGNCFQYVRNMEGFMKEFRMIYDKKLKNSTKQTIAKCAPKSTSMEFLSVAPDASTAGAASNTNYSGNLYGFDKSLEGTVDAASKKILARFDAEFSHPVNRQSVWDTIKQQGEAVVGQLNSQAVRIAGALGKVHEVANVVETAEANTVSMAQSNATASANCSGGNCSGANAEQALPAGSLQDGSGKEGQIKWQNAADGSPHMWKYSGGKWKDMIGRSVHSPMPADQAQRWIGISNKAQAQDKAVFQHAGPTDGVRTYIKTPDGQTGLYAYDESQKDWVRQEWDRDSDSFQDASDPDNMYLSQAAGSSDCNSSTGACFDGAGGVAPAIKTASGSSTETGGVSKGSDGDTAVHTTADLPVADKQMAGDVPVTEASRHAESAQQTVVPGAGGLPQKNEESVRAVEEQRQQTITTQAHCPAGQARSDAGTCVDQADIYDDGGPSEPLPRNVPSQGVTATPRACPAGQARSDAGICVDQADIYDDSDGIGGTQLDSASVQRRQLAASGGSNFEVVDGAKYAKCVSNCQVTSTEGLTSAQRRNYNHYVTNRNGKCEWKAKQIYHPPVYRGTGTSRRMVSAKYYTIEKYVQCSLQ